MLLKDKTMKKIVVLFQGLCLINSFTNAMINQYHYQKATSQDVTDVVALINNQAAKDDKNLVVLPKKFREVGVQKNIELGKLFVARDSSSTLVGYKKLYLPDENECSEIMRDEIRAIGPQSHLVDSYYFDQDNKKCRINNNTSITPDLSKSIVIYNGNDFTTPQHREKGVNHNLSVHAFDHITDEVIAQIKKQGALYLVCCYGLTKDNAGELDSNSRDRAPEIFRLFKSFVQKIQSHFYNLNTNPDTNELIIYLNRYKAFKPMFNPESQECKPLDDDQSVEGYGNVLFCQLKQDQLNKEIL